MQTRAAKRKIRKVRRAKRKSEESNGLSAVLRQSFGVTAGNTDRLCTETDRKKVRGGAQAYRRAPSARSDEMPAVFACFLRTLTGAGLFDRYRAML